MIHYKKLFLASLMFLALASNTATAQSDVIPLDKNVKMGKLANGLTYYIRKNLKPEGKVELHLAVNTGSVLEKDNQQGVAHFLEHMAFNGTTHFPKNELTNYLQKAGVRFGADLNAHTSFDETVYDLPISSKDPVVLHNGYQIIRDWAGNLLLDATEIDQERGIILEEKRMRLGAGMRMMIQYFPPLFNNSMYSKRLPIGTEEIIKTAPRKAFTDFYKDWYRPNNMAVIVVGDIDVAAAEATIKAMFSDLKNPANAPVRPSLIPIEWHKENKSYVIADKENTSNVVQIFVGLNKSENQLSWKSYADNTLNNLITSIIGSRLQEYRLKASSPIGFGGISLDGGQFRGYKQITLRASVKSDVNAAITTIVGEALKAKKFGFTSAEFERAKKEMLESVIEQANEKDKTESSSFAREYISNFLDKEPSQGIEAEKAFTENFLKTLTLEKVNATIAKLNLDEPSFVLYTATEGAKNLPTEASLLVAYEAAKKQTVEAYTETVVSKELMDKAPTAGSIVKTDKNSDFNTTTFTLSNGIKVITKKTDFKNDEILVRGYQWGGNTILSEAEIKTAKYLLVANQLGLGKHTSSELQKMLTGVNAKVSLAAGNNNFTISGNSSVKDFEKFMQMFYLKLTSINFDKEEMEGIRSTFKQQIGMIKNNPSIKFSDTLNKYRYNNSKRISGIPDAAEVEALNFDDVIAVYNKLTGNLNGATILFVGNIDEATLKPLLEKYVASIPTKSSIVAVNTANIVRPIVGNNTFIVKGGKENKSEIQVSYYGNLTSFNDKENLAYGLLAEVLQMKTTEKLREEMGGTYSPRVGGQMMRSPMLDYTLTLSVPAAPENVDKLTTAFDELVKKVAGGDVNDDDMLKVTEQRKKLFETQQKTNAYWATTLEQQDMYNYNPTLITTYLTRLYEIKKEDLVAVAKKYLLTASVLKAVLNPDK